MNKSRKRYDAAKALVIKNLAIKHGCGEDFVRKAINNERDSDLALTVKKEYGESYKTITEALKVLATPEQSH